MTDEVKLGNQFDCHDLIFHHHFIMSVHIWNPAAWAKNTIVFYVITGNKAINPLALSSAGLRSVNCKLPCMGRPIHWAWWDSDPLPCVFARGQDACAGPRRGGPPGPEDDDPAAGLLVPAGGLHADAVWRSSQATQRQGKTDWLTDWLTDLFYFNYSAHTALIQSSGFRFVVVIQPLFIYSGRWHILSYVSIYYLCLSFANCNATLDRAHLQNRYLSQCDFSLVK